MSITGEIVNATSGGINAISGASEVVAKKITGGEISVSNGAYLIVNSIVEGRVLVIIDNGALDFTKDFNHLVAFTSGGGELELAHSQIFTKDISGFEENGRTTLDLDDIGFVSSGEATFSGTRTGGILTITDGAHTASFHLEGDFLGATFTATSNGHGGTLVTAGTGASKPLHAMISAMASFGASHAHANQVAEAGSAREPLLVAPRVAMA